MAPSTGTPFATKRVPVLKLASLLCGQRHVSFVARRPTPHPDVQFALDSDGNTK